MGWLTATCTLCHAAAAQVSRRQRAGEISGATVWGEGWTTARRRARCWAIGTAVALTTVACGAPSAPLASRPLPQSPLTPRERAAAAWVGSQMVVVGGARRAKTGTAVFDDVAAFSPASGTWRAQRPFPLGPRQGAMAVTRGNSLMVWGGEGACDGESCPSERTGAVLDLRSGRWSRYAAGTGVDGMSDGTLAVSCGAAFAAGGGRGQGPSRDDRVITGAWSGRHWRTVRLGDPVYDLAAGSLAAYVVTVDAQQHAVLHVLDGCSGDEVRQVPQRDDLKVTGVWVEVVGDRVLLARSDSRRVRVQTLTDDGAWATAADLSADAMPMPRSATSLTGWSGVAGHDVFGVTDLGVWRFDVRTHEVRAVDTPVEACGVGASAVVSASQLLVWGGQRCDDAPTLQTSAGLSVPAT
ncbi:MAG: hypothetical protein ACTHLJ_05085 [Angustibacter sp.]